MKPPELSELYQRSRTTIRTQILDATAPDDTIDICSAYERSKAQLGEYVTLDWQHRADIIKVRRAIQRYAEDRTRKRPLNIVMQAEPGSGKSHLVKCLAKRVFGTDAAAVDYNLANLRGIEDLTQPLDSVRNLKVIDKLPILFLDEFDSDIRIYPLLLPLLWDGELHIGHRDLKLGKVVIILAGSTSGVQKAIKSAKGMLPTTTNDESGKLTDLLSRINGGELSIPPLDLVTNGRDRQVDKVCLTITLLERRFGRLEMVPWSLLKFAGATRFRYGVRSVAHLIDLISPRKADEKPSQLPSNQISPEQCTLPLESVKTLRNSSLAYHVEAEDGPGSIVDSWTKISGNQTMVKVQAPLPDEDVPF